MNIELCDDNFIFENFNQRKVKITIEFTDGEEFTNEDFCIHTNNSKYKPIKSYYDIRMPQKLNLVGEDAEKLLQHMIDHPQIILKE